MKIEIFKRGEETRVKGKPVVSPPVLFRRPYASITSFDTDKSKGTTYDESTSEVSFKIRNCRMMAPFRNSYKEYFVRYHETDYDIDEIRFDLNWLTIRCKHGI